MIKYWKINNHVENLWKCDTIYNDVPTVKLRRFVSYGNANIKQDCKEGRVSSDDVREECKV